MTDIYHAVIVGGGHNGLAVATYLAKAGKRVQVSQRWAPLLLKTWSARSLFPTTLQRRVSGR